MSNAAVMSEAVVDLDTVVDEYIACGREHGFAVAEFILSVFVPDDAPDAKCFEVPREKRGQLIKALRAGIRFGRSPQ